MRRDHAEVEAIVTRYGRVPLDYFKTWPDKSYFFASSHQSVVAYRVACSVAVSLGDPVGPMGELEPLLEAFVRFCAGRGWRVAFQEVLPDLLPVYRGQGFRVQKIGEEALVDLERFATHTSEEHGFRKARHHLEAAGYRVTREPGPHSESWIDEVQEVSDEWLSLPGRRERAFTLGRFDRRYLAQHPLVLARDADGRLVGFLNEVPGVRAGLATVDLMRHRRGVPNGLMDYLFTELMLLLREEGYRWFSLGLAPLAGVGDHPGAPILDRVFHQVFKHASAIFSFKGLRNFKAKFEPRWEERFLVYQPGLTGLVRTALALGRITWR